MFTKSASTAYTTPCVCVCVCVAECTPYTARRPPPHAPAAAHAIHRGGEVTGFIASYIVACTSGTQINRNIYVYIWYIMPVGINVQQFVEWVTGHDNYLPLTPLKLTMGRATARSPLRLPPMTNDLASQRACVTWSMPQPSSWRPWAIQIDVCNLVCDEVLRCVSLWDDADWALLMQMASGRYIWDDVRPKMKYSHGNVVLITFHFACVVDMAYNWQ